jgi:integrase
LAEILAAFVLHCEDHYAKPDGTPTSELGVFKPLIRLLNELYGSTYAADFGPLALKAVRQAMIDKGWKRSSINKQVNRIKHIFKSAVAQEMIPASVYQALTTLDGLRRGRSDAEESEPKKPVPEEHVEAVRPFVSRQVWALIQLQLFTAARAGELVAMRPLDLDMTSDKTENQDRLWYYRPTEHKTAHHGHRRTIYLNARAQALIEPFLSERAVDSYLFSPIESEAERRAEQHQLRRTPEQPSQMERAERTARRKRTRPLGPHYTVASYRRAIARACELANRWAKGGRIIGNDERIIPVWHPHRLRHNAATTIRRECGIELARIILGHKSVEVTEICAEADEAKAREAMRRMG